GVGGAKPTGCAPWDEVLGSFPHGMQPVGLTPLSRHPICTSPSVFGFSFPTSLRRERPMALLSKPSSAARMSLAYITVGALMLVWTVVGYTYLYAYVPDWNYLYSLCFGLMATGGVLLIIGLALGQIGRAARHAELPPPEVTPEMAKISE